jgi:hypothetical protein
MTSLPMRLRSVSALKNLVPPLSALLFFYTLVIICYLFDEARPPEVRKSILRICPFWGVIEVEGRLRQNAPYLKRFSGPNSCIK